MADGDETSGKTYREIDHEAIDQFNKNMQLSMEREARLQRHYDWRGNKLPPFSIEHMPLERQRLTGTGMTDEDRMLRRQWLKDQELAPNEPVYIPQLFPKNPIRRLINKPWDTVFNVLRPVLSDWQVKRGRYAAPRVALGLFLVYTFYYHVKFNPNQWTDKCGWNVYSSKPIVFYGEMPPEKTHDDFFDRGFKQRKSHRDL